MGAINLVTHLSQSLGLGLPVVRLDTGSRKRSLQGFALTLPVRCDLSAESFKLRLLRLVRH